MAVTITQGTTTGIATDLVGTNHYQYVKLDVGASGAASAFTGTLGAVTNLAGGTITSVAAGTINTMGTLGSIIGIGTITNAGSVTNIGTLKGVDSVAELVKGTVTSVGTAVGVGTLSNVGSVNTITTVTNLTSGSVRMTVGTVTTGSLSNVAMVNAGTFVMASGTLTTMVAGTQQTLGTVGVVNSIVAGTQNTLGTVGAVNSIVAGTQNTLGTVGVVNNVAGGTVQLNPVPTPTMLTFGTLGTAGGSFFATLSAASGAGTKHYISGIDIVMDSGTADVRILAGSAIQGTGVLVAGKFPAGGGISKRITPAFATGTNSELIYHFVGAGTAYIVINYWKGA